MDKFRPDFDQILTNFGQVGRISDKFRTGASAGTRTEAGTGTERELDRISNASESGFWSISGPVTPRLPRKFSIDIHTHILESRDACILDSQLEAGTLGRLLSRLSLDFLLGKSHANRSRHVLKIDPQIDPKSLPGPSPGHHESSQN